MTLHHSVKVTAGNTFLHLGLFTSLYYYTFTTLQIQPNTWVARIPPVPEHQILPYLYSSKAFLSTAIRKEELEMT